MIRIKDLTTANIGSWVLYRRLGRGPELGRIKYWNSALVFVVYRCDNQWDRFLEFTPEGTFPEDLEFTASEKS